MTYLNRKQAGIKLASFLDDYIGQEETIVLALPRGGVPVAYEIATHLQLPLDVLIVRKLGAPHHEELAMGALAPGNTVVWNKALFNSLAIDETSIQQILQAERLELKRRDHLYRGHRPFPNLQGKTVILVDDGIATGATIKAALAALENFQPKTIIIAVPVAAQTSYQELTQLGYRVICPLQPIELDAVGFWYEDFSQTQDEEVVQALEQAQQKGYENNRS